MDVSAEQLQDLLFTEDEMKELLRIQDEQLTYSAAIDLMDRITFVTDKLPAEATMLSRIALKRIINCKPFCIGEIPCCVSK